MGPSVLITGFLERVSVALAFYSLLLRLRQKHEMSLFELSFDKWSCLTVSSLMNFCAGRGNFKKKGSFLRRNKEVTAVASLISGFQCSVEFLVACYATLHPAMSVRWSVGRLVPFLLFRRFLDF